MSRNERDPMLPHGTDKCQCSDCKLYFNSSYAFGEHRKGPWDARTCMTEEELVAAHWVKTETGHWATKGLTRSVVKQRQRGAKQPAT